MNFRGSGRPMTIAGMTDVCDALGADSAALWTVLSVETHSFGFFADRRPQILFERHIFHRRTAGRYDATHPGISGAASGGYAFGVAEYPRLEEAMQLNEDAALSSASWGIGQIMGFNHETAGFASAAELVTAMISGEDTQLQAVGTFLSRTGLAAALKQQNWIAFARGYNGPDFLRNDYANKLAAAYGRFQQTLPDLTYRAAQTALLYLGYHPGPIDGRHGARTGGALSSFQRANGIAVSGDLDAVTTSSLMAAAFPN